MKTKPGRAIAPSFLRNARFTSLLLRINERARTVTAGLDRAWNACLLDINRWQ